MSVSTTIPATVEIRRSRLLGLMVGVATVAAAIAWALTAYALGDQGRRSVSGRAVMSSPTWASVLSSLSPQERSYLEAMTAVCSVAVCPPEERLAARLGIASISAPRRANVLSSLSPQERSYLKAMTAVCSVVMCQPNDQFAAVAGLVKR
jgi:hypothetical protein